MDGVVCLKEGKHLKHVKCNSTGTHVLALFFFSLSSSVKVPGQDSKGHF